MKSLTTHFRQSPKIHIALICIFCIPHIAFAIEPIATIGQPLPEKHALLNNETILRVVPTHIQIVDFTTNEVMEEFGERTVYSDVVISPNTDHLAILNHSFDPKMTIVNIWDVNHQQLISQWKIASIIDDNDAAFSPTQPILATYLPSGIHFWNWKTGESVGKLPRENFPSLRSMVFTPDDEHLIVASQHNLELWNVETQILQGNFAEQNLDRIEDMALSPNGKMVAAFEYDSTLVHLWDVETRQKLWHRTSGIGRISNVVFSPDSQRLYVGTSTAGLHRSGATPYTGWDDKVRVWDVMSGEKTDTFSTDFRFLESIILSPNEKTAILEYWDGDVVWDIANNREHDVWADYVRNRFIYDVALSPDGKSLVTVSWSFIKTWDVTSQQMQALVPSEGYAFDGLAISPDNKTFAVGKDPWVELRDIQSGRVKIQFPHYVSGALEIAFSPSGKWLAVVNDWNDLLFLDTNNPDKIQKVNTKIENDSPDFQDIAFSENDKYLAASCRTGKNNTYKYWIALWKREHETFILQYVSQVPRIYSSPAFSIGGDGSIVLAAYGGREIHIWKVLLNGLQHLTAFDGDDPVQFSPDGRYLFANQDNNFQIWDWQRNRPVKHTPFPGISVLSKDGSVLLSPDRSGQYMVWDIKELLSFLPYPVEPKGKKYVTLGQIKKNQLLQNFPNPFNPETWIPFKLADKSDVTIRIYTPTGKLVRSLSPGIMSAGDYSSQAQAVHWDGHNDEGEAVSSGIYLYTINAGDFSATRKMLIRK